MSGGGGWLRHWGLQWRRSHRWQQRRDKGPGGPASDQVTLANQQLVGRFHRAARQVQLGGQGANGRHPIARAQAAVGNRGTKSLIQLTVDRC